MVKLLPPVVALVAPAVWHPACERAFQSLSAKERRLAEAMLTTLHNRHVGITPQLVAELVPALLDAVRKPSGAWEVVFTRLVEALTVVDDAPNNRIRGVGLLFGATALYSIVRVVQPLIEEACRQLNACYLFAGDSVDATVDAHAYRSYSGKLRRKLRDIALSDDMVTFWRERAATLSSLSRYHQDATLPAVDPLEAGLLLRLHPDLPPLDRPNAPPQRSPVMLRHQRSQNSREEGIEGIRMTRSIEDIHHMRFSEYINPKAVFADRLVNTGYLASQRQSLREKLRDVLIVGLLAPGITSEISTNVVRACWFETMMQLSFMLRRHKLLHSEFRWVEADPFDRMRTASFLLDDMPQFKDTFERAPSRAYRQEFLTALHWLPHFLDQQGDFKRLSTYTPDADPLENAHHWVNAAWLAQRDHVAWQGLTPLPSNTITNTFDEFAFVCLMVFFPAEVYDPTQPDLLRLQNRLGLNYQTGRSVMITWIPPQPQDTDHWHIASQGTRRADLFAGTRAATLPAVTGQVVQTWLNELKREIWHA